MVTKATHPLVSCICITDNRPALLSRAIFCFYAQSYPNKELVISYPETDHATKKLIDDVLKHIDIKLICMERPQEYSMGTAKNHAISRCTGDYICTWDDDDWYHSLRIAHQLNTMIAHGKFYQACLLTHIILYDTLNETGYYSFPHYWAGSLLCKKEIVLQIPFEDSNVGEDLRLLQFLASKNLIYEIGDSEFLYMYLFHGKNILNHIYFQYFTQKSQQLDAENSKLLANQLLVV